MIAEETLLHLNRSGIVPGSEETEEAFLKRVERLKKRESSSDVPSFHWDWARLQLKNLFDLEPLYVEASYSNRSLTFWQGAACWVDETGDVSIQLRENLRKGTYLKMYERDEILAHEAVHAARAKIEGNRFEEFFAYMSSDKKWRRVFGPIIQSSWEIWPLLFFGGLSWISNWGFFLSALWLLFGFFRLIRSHTILNRAASHLMKDLLDVRKVRAILVRLSDEEIVRFARGDDFIKYVRNRNCLRWKAIQLAYFPEHNVV